MTNPKSPIPVLSRAAVREIDRRAVEEYGMSGLVLMENAGRGVVEVMRHLAVDGPVAICCGKGNNGGDGFVIARHLELCDIEPRILLFAEPKELTGDAAANFAIAEQAGLSIEVFGRKFDALSLARALDGVPCVVDVLLGTGARGEPRAPLDAVIDQLNRQDAIVVAVDVPSGLDCDTGQPAKHTIRADVTCTFVAAKPGLLADGAGEYVGSWHVVDIGVPRKLIEEVRSSFA